MATFRIDVPDKAVAGLQAVVKRYNEDNGATLSVQEWIVLHLKDIVVGPDLAAAMPAIREEEEKKANDALAARIAAKRQELLAALQSLK